MARHDEFGGRHAPRLVFRIMYSAERFLHILIRLITELARRSTAKVIVKKSSKRPWRHRFSGVSRGKSLTTSDLAVGYVSFWEPAVEGSIWRPVWLQIRCADIWMSCQAKPVPARIRAWDRKYRTLLVVTKFTISYYKELKGFNFSQFNI